MAPVTVAETHHYMQHVTCWTNTGTLNTTADNLITYLFAVICSESRKVVEHASTVDTTREAERFLREHPERLEDFRRWLEYVGGGHAHNHHVVTQLAYLILNNCNRLFGWEIKRHKTQKNNPELLWICSRLIAPKTKWCFCFFLIFV